MSIIWDLVQEPESPERRDMAELPSELISERRRSSRVSLYVPLFVYGYTSTQEPFYQETNTLEVNANGGLLHLNAGANVRRGQKLLVLNRLTKEEQQCYVVTLAKWPKRAELRVGVAFVKPAPEFWTRRKEEPARQTSAVSR